MEPSLRQLRTLKAIVVAGSFTDAARLTGLSQPTLSQQMAKFEKDLGVQLVRRVREGGLDLTPAGEFWYRAACDLLDRAEALARVHEGDFAARGLAIRFGATPSLRGPLMRTVARFAADSGDIGHFEFHWVLDSAQALDMIEARKLNVAVVSARAAEAVGTATAVTPIFQDRLLWVVPESVPEEAVAEAMGQPQGWAPAHPALRRTVSVESMTLWRSVSEAWFRGHLAFSVPFFSVQTHQAAVDLVAEELATCHAPISLFPNLSKSTVRAVRLYDIGIIPRDMVLVMPRHQLSLRAFAEFRDNLVRFATTTLSASLQAHPPAPLPVPISVGPLRG